MHRQYTEEERKPYLSKVYGNKFWRYDWNEHFQQSTYKIKLDRL